MHFERVRVVFIKEEICFHLHNVFKIKMWFKSSRSRVVVLICIVCVSFNLPLVVKYASISCVTEYEDRLHCVLKSFFGYFHTGVAFKEVSMKILFKNVDIFQFFGNAKSLLMAKLVELLISPLSLSFRRTYWYSLGLCKQTQRRWPMRTPQNKMFD